MMSCRQVTRLLSDAQERKLSLKERMALKFHMMMCSGCRNFADHMKTLRDIAHSYTKGEGGKEQARASQSDK